MRRCLSESTLFFVYTGEGTEQQRAHLSLCLSCRARYERLQHDMERIERLLRLAPPSWRASLQAGPRLPRWLPPLAALAAALLLVLWSSLHGRPSADPVLVAAVPPQQAAPAQFIDRELGPSLLSVDEDDDDDDEDDEDDEGRVMPQPESDVVAIVMPVSSSAYVQAALEGGWPCEWQAPFHAAGCELSALPLVLGQQ
jgi:hypothetical protein